MKKYYETNFSAFKGCKHTEETKEKVRNSDYHKNCSGKNNYNYGKCWVCSIKFSKNKLIKKENLNFWLNKGWIKGREMRFNVLSI